MKIHAQKVEQIYRDMMGVLELCFQQMFSQVWSTNGGCGQTDIQTNRQTKKELPQKINNTQDNMSSYNIISQVNKIEMKKKFHKL